MKFYSIMKEIFEMLYDNEENIPDNIREIFDFTIILIYVWNKCF